MPHGLPENCGYVPNLAHANSLAVECASFATDLEALSFASNKSAFLYRAIVEVLKGNPKYVRNGVLRAFSQGKHGSCVGCGEAHKTAATLAGGIWLRGEELDWPVDDAELPVMPSRSWIYGASRQVVDRLGRWEGSNGSAAAKAIDEMGIAWERNCGGVDLSEYRPEDCDRWEARGVPKATLPVAKQVTLGGKVRVESWEQAAAALQHGYGINICQCYKPVRTTRDDYGAIELGSPWSHSQVVWGYVVYGSGRNRTRLFVIYNSHGNKYKGPKGPLTPDLPDGAYCITTNEMQEILDNGDSWISCDRTGLAPRSRSFRRIAKKKGARHAMAA